MVIDPRAVADRHPDPMVRAIVSLSVAVTERPWSITGADLDRARAGGLDDAAVLHVVLQSSLFGHFNRIADAVGVDLDYADRFGTPHAEPATPAYLRPVRPPAAEGARPIELASREGAIELAGVWEGRALERDAPLTRAQRRLIAATVADSLGDTSVPPAVPETDVDRALIALADVVTRAPWQLGATAYAGVRQMGLSDDRDVFDVVATASSAGVFSRIRTTLVAFGR